MGFCCVVGCSNRHGRNKYKEGVRFHSFPMDQTLRDRWIQAIRRVHWKPTYHSRVCTEHFSDDVVDRTYVSGLRLRVGAVPSIFPTHPGHLKKSLSYRKRMRFLKLWGVKDCDVVISGKEREIADAALPRWKEYEQRMGRLCLDVPLPIVDVKEVEPVQNRLLPPLIIDRDIIPFAVEGHDIEPSSILEHLKDKIRIKIEKGCASDSVKETHWATFSAQEISIISGGDYSPSSTSILANMLPVLRTLPLRGVLHKKSEYKRQHCLPLGPHHSPNDLYTGSRPQRCECGPPCRGASPTSWGQNLDSA